MESFFRYITYVDYYRKGEQIKNVGFLRWKLYKGEHQVELQIKDVNCLQGEYEIKEKNTGKIIGKVPIDKGIGNFIKKFHPFRKEVKRDSKSHAFWNIFLSERAPSAKPQEQQRSRGEPSSRHRGKSRASVYKRARRRGMSPRMPRR